MKYEIETSSKEMAGKKEIQGTSENIFDMIRSITDLNKKIVMDICCCDGRLVRKIAGTGSRVIGVSERDKVKRLRNLPPVCREKYAFGRPEDIPAPDNYCDLIIYNEVLYKFNETLPAVMRETRRALKRKGKLLIIEPVFIPGSYSEMIELIEKRKNDCLEIYSKLKAPASYGFDHIKEKYHSVHKDFDDFVLRAEMTIQNFNAYSEIINTGKRKYNDLVKDKTDSRKLPLHYRLSFLEKNITS